MFCFRFMIIVVLCRSFVLGQGPEGVQLVGGSNQYKGRVEVSYNGHWATVCDKNFDKTDALFICRGLGLENVETIQVFKDLRYGQGTGPVITDLGCTGDEPNLHQCLQGQWDVSTCKHSEDVALDCQTPVYLEDNAYNNTGEVKVTVSGANYSVCSDVFGPREAEVTCRMLGFSTGNTRTLILASTNPVAVSNLNCTGQEADISDCGSNPLAIAECSDVAHLECRTAMRLANGPTAQSGRVELFYNDEWGTVCDDFFDDEDAAVICRTLGFNPRNAISYGSAYFGLGNGSIIIDELECIGDEIDVSQCRSNPWVSHTNCDHSEDAGVECLTEVRLVDGPTYTSGRVEVKQGTQWYTFCDEDFTNDTATVICNMLGHRQGNVTVHKRAYYGASIVDSVDYTPICHGNETDVVQCRKEENETTCSSNNTTGINCYSVTPVRLAGGWKSLVGKVELFSMYDRSWLSLCHSSFTLADAQVVCKMLGKQQSNPTLLRAHGFYDFIIRDVGLHNLNCVGDESDVSECLSLYVWKNSTCGYTDFVGLNCEPVTPIRLVDGPSIRAGRVELLYNNTWGRVCRNYIGLQERAVLCRMLGCTNGSLDLSSSYFPTGSSPYIVSNLTCVGTESDVSNCVSNAWLSTSYCSYSAVGIALKTPVRLVNGSYERSGRVEVYHNGSWGSVCADAVDREVANVICRGVGFRFWNATVLTGSKFGEGSLSLINNLTCSGGEVDISMCRGGPWAAISCSQGAAAVDCKQQVTPIRLVNTGTTPYSGIVEVFYNNKWGPISSYGGITKQTVDVLCLNLGYNFSRDASWTYSSYSCRSYMITGLRCHGNESDVSECPSNAWDTSYTCSSYMLNINCLTPIFLQYGRTKSMGIVRLIHNSTSGSICADGFTAKNGRVICSMLGYNYTRNVEKNTFNNLSQKVIIDGLNCTGDEADIYLCLSNPWTLYNNCSSAQAVGISCNTPVRLTDGPTPRVGKVHVKINGQWARVCSGNSTSQSKNVGQVVCRELGYSTRQVSITEAVVDADEITYNIVCFGDEDDPSLCQIEEASCFKDMALGVSCDTPLSLLYGRTKYMGQVHISVSESGGISPNGLNDTDANHVCRLLGHNYTMNAMLQSPIDLRFYSQNDYYTRTVVDSLQCTGTESDISDCIPNFHRWQNRDVNAYDNIKINCQTPLRVVNGQSYIHGEVQLFSNNKWTSVCANNFTAEDAFVVCRMMGHSHVRNATIYNVSSKDKNISEEYLSGGFQCIGEEEDISQCNNMLWDTKECDRLVKIDCRTTARILDGPTSYEGRIELSVNDTWLPLCSDTYVNHYEARILCRMAGFIETSPVVRKTEFSFSDSLFLTNLKCVGSETTISECSSTNWTTEVCSNTYVVTLACYTPIEIIGGSNKYNGQVRLNPFGSWKYICADSFDEADATVICNRLGYITNSTQTKVSRKSTGSAYQSIEDLQCAGNESDVQACNHSNWKTNPSSCNVAFVNCQPVTPVRLVDGLNNASGRVEVFYNGQWGTVCDDNFDDIDANVFCSMLGYRVGVTIDNIPGSGPIFIDDLACTGLENDVSECSSNYWGVHNCHHGEDVAIHCIDKRPIRLTNGHNMYRGHVEIQYLGQWHTVCGDHMDHNDTGVICRELGVVDEQKATIYKAGVVPLYNYWNRWIQDLMCNGTEDIIDDCSSYPWPYSAPSCSQRSVAINCRPHTPIRLVGGPNKYSGRVEVEYPVGSWSTICDYDFEEQDAQVICRSLGFNDKSVGVKLRSYYGHESLSASISHLNCSSLVGDISDCNVGYEWGSPYAYCDSTRQAGVQCNTPVRISGGRTKYSGLIEVYYQHAWGTICGEGFDRLDAQTICNILGLRDQYNGSIVVNKGAFYGKSLGHVLLKNLNCTGDEGDLYECGTLQWMNNNCSHDQDVTLNCRATTELRLMNGDNEVAFDRMEVAHVEGRVEVFYDGQWGTICNDHFDDDDAFVLCSMKGYIAGIYRFNTDTYGPGTGPITVDDLYCTGDEPDVSECWSREWRVHDCDHDEDVVIECYYEENPDPCNKFNHRPLPHLESRYVNFNTEGQDTAFNDSRLATRWYNVGNEVMPNYAPKLHSCGTTYPVYLKGSPIPGSEAGQVDRVACQVTNDSDCGHTYNISIKLCPDSTYVYRLGSTLDEHSGYCFGIGSEGQAPDFVPANVRVTRRPNAYSFVCDFLASEADLFYSVVWQIQSDRDISLTKGYCNGSNMTLLDITEEDLLNRSIKIGFKLVCSVRAYMVPGGPPGRLSNPSSTFFAGIQILTPSISMRRGETKAIEFRLTVPFSCDEPECTLNLMSFTPDYGNCQSNSLSFSSGSCGLRIKQKDAGSIQHLDITSAETGQYGMSGSFQVFLQSATNANISPLWKDIKLPAIEVKILPEADRKWRGRLCAARNDPHMYTFDGRQYEHHVKGSDHLQDTKGTFVLYKNIKYGNDVEIQHRVTPCTTPDNPAMCNCGVAVRAGRDVYVISVCDSLIDIGYKHCGDNSLTVKKEDDTTYTVYLPYGTAVRVRIDIQPWMGPEGGMALDISVNPSVYDQEGNSRGLCGTLDGDPDNDFHHTDINGNATSIEEDIDFINRWRVNETDSMFSKHLETMDFNPWLFPVCVCNNDGSSKDILPCKSSIQTCTPGVSTGTHSCYDVSSRRSVRSLNRRPTIPAVPIPTHSIAKQRTKRSASTGPWTKDSAEKYCNQAFSESNTYEKCQQVPFTHTNVSMENCVLDILLTNSTEWLALTIQSMQDSCISTLMKNSTVRREVAENVTADGSDTDTSDPLEIVINSIIAEVAVTCKFNCNDNGYCNNGTCDCYKGFGGSDCSVNTTRPPTLVGVLDHGMCDVVKGACDVIYGFGGIFLGRNLTCRLRKSVIDRSGKERQITSFTTDGHAESLAEVICPVSTNSIQKEDLPLLRDRQNIDSSPFVVVYNVSVSNTGEYSGEQRVYVYNSTCQTYVKSEDSIMFYLKNGTCYIDGECYAAEETHPDDKYRVCNPSLSDDKWTVITTTTTITTTSSSGAAHQRETKLTLTLDYTISDTENLDDPAIQMKYKDETKKALENLYRERFGNAWVNLNISKVSRGSLIVEHTIVVMNYIHADDVLYDLLSGDTSATVVLFNKTVNVKELGVIDDTMDDKTTRQTGLEIKLDYDPGNDDLKKINTSIKYVTEARKALTQRYRVWFAEKDFRKVLISSVRRGSLIIEHNLFTAKGADNHLVKLVAGGANNLIEVHFFDKPVKVKSLTIVQDDKGQVCAIYAEINNCPCEIEQGSPRCKIEKAETNNSVLTIWVPVTSGLVLIILVILVVVICKRRVTRSKQKAQTTESQSGYDYLVPNWIVNSSRGGGGVYSMGSQGSAPSSYSDGRSLKGSMLPRLTSDGNSVTAKPDYYTIPGDKDNVFYGVN